MRGLTHAEYELLLDGMVPNSVIFYKCDGTPHEPYTIEEAQAAVALEARGLMTTWTGCHCETATEPDITPLGRLAVSIHETILMWEV